MSEYIEIPRDISIQSHRELHWTSDEKNWTDKKFPNMHTIFKILDNIEIKKRGPRGSKTNSYCHFNETDDKWYCLDALGYIDIVCMNIMMDKNLYNGAEH